MVDPVVLAFPTFGVLLLVLQIEIGRDDKLAEEPESESLSQPDKPRNALQIASSPYNMLAYK